MRVLAALDRRTLALLLCNAALLCVVALQAASRSHFKAQVHALTLDLVVVSRDRNNLLALLPPTGVVGESEAVRAAALEVGGGRLGGRRPGFSPPRTQLGWVGARGAWGVRRAAVRPRARTRGA